MSGGRRRCSLTSPGAAPYADPLLAAGLELVEVAPSTVLANNPIEASSKAALKRYQRWWRFVVTRTRQTGAVSRSIGPILWLARRSDWKTGAVPTSKLALFLAGRRSVRSSAAAVPGDDTADARVAVVGLGYVGLPLALSFHEAGLDVVGLDASPARVPELRAGARRSTTSTTCAWAEAWPTASGSRGPRGRSRPRPMRCSCASRRRSHDKDPDLAGPVCGGLRVRRAPPRPAGRPPIHDLPGHDPRPVPRRARARRPARRASTSTSPSRRSASTRATRRAPRATSRGWSAGRPRRPPPEPPACSAPSTPRSTSSRARTPPSSPSCSRTCSATSTSPS